MTFNLQGALEHITASFPEWYRVLRSPSRGAREIMREPSGQKLATAIRLWLTAALLSLVLQLPLLLAFGLEADNWLALVANVTTSLLIFLSLPFVVTGVLRLRGGVAPDFEDVLVVYACHLGVYAPFFTLLSYPYTYQVFSALQDGGVVGAWGWITGAASDPTEPADAASTALAPIVALAFLWLQPRSARELSDRYQLEYHRAFSLVALSVAAWAVPAALLSSLEWLAISSAFASPTS